MKHNIFNIYQNNKWFMSAIEAVIIGLILWIFIPWLLKAFIYIFITVVIISNLNKK